MYEKEKEGKGERENRRENADTRAATAACRFSMRRKARKRNAVAFHRNRQKAHELTRLYGQIKSTHSRAAPSSFLKGSFFEAHGCSGNQLSDGCGAARRDRNAPKRKRAERNGRVGARRTNAIMRNARTWTGGRWLAGGRARALALCASSCL